MLVYDHAFPTEKEMNFKKLKEEAEKRGIALTIQQFMEFSDHSHKFVFENEPGQSIRIKRSDVRKLLELAKELEAEQELYELAVPLYDFKSSMIFWRPPHRIDKPQGIITLKEWLEIFPS